MRFILASLLMSAVGVIGVTAHAADNPKPCMIQILSSPWPKNDRLLIFGSFTIRARGDDGTYAWTFLPDGPEHATFKENNGPNYRTTTLTALDFPTPTASLNKEKVQVKLTKSDGSECRDQKALNLTYPRYFVLDATQDILPPPAGGQPPPPNQDPGPAIVRATTFGQGSPNEVAVLDELVKYTINDQFSTVITDSDRGGKHVVTKEAVNLKPTPPAQFRLPDTQPDFATNDDGFQSDRLRLVAILTSFRNQQTGLFDRSFIGKTVATFNMTHDWITGVDNKHPTQVTANTLTIVVTSITNGDRDITFTTTYTVVPK